MLRFPFATSLAACALGLITAFAPATAHAGYYGPCYHLTACATCGPVAPPAPVCVPTVRAAPTFLTPVPAPVVYSGGSYAFSGPSFVAGSAYGPNYVAPNFNTQRYPNPGPYWYTAGGAYTPGYYSYYYTPGYFRY
jgi:hypothetical protein